MSQAHVITGMVFPSAGVRGLIQLVVAAFMEEASGTPMRDLSDYNIGMSVGGIFSTAFAMSRPDGSPHITARHMLYDTLAVSAVMFGENPDRVLFNNFRRDVPRFVHSAAASNAWIGYVANSLARFSPDVRASRYDHSLLQQTLAEKFGAARMQDAAKTNLVLAHSLDECGPALFGHIDEGVFPSDGIETSLRAQAADDAIPVHGDVDVTKALMAATAIPGLIGYCHVETLAQHFMDAGSLSAPVVLEVAKDLHRRAENRLQRAHVPAPQSGWWARLRGAKPMADMPPQAAMRLIFLGIGDEKGIPFDRSGETGVAAEAGTVMRAAGDLVTRPALVGLMHAFNKASKDMTGRPALSIINAPICGEGITTLPSVDIKDGRPENLARIVEFGINLAVSHRETIFEEIELRLRTLMARGDRRYDEVRATVERMAGFVDEARARALCAPFATAARNIPALLEEKGLGGRMVVHGRRRKTAAPVAVPLNA